MKHRIIVYGAAIFTGLVMTAATSFIQTGSQPFNNNDNFIVTGNTVTLKDGIRDANGSLCEFKQHGLPFKAISSTYEPCAYQLSQAKQPYGIRFLYNYINVYLVIANVIVWSLFVRGCMVLGKRLS